MDRVLVSDFDFALPRDLIAQEPLADRAGSRLLRLGRPPFPELQDDYFRNFPELLRPDDLLVFNDTRVFPARLYARRHVREPARAEAPRSTSETGIEVLLTRQLSSDPNEWECLVRPGRKVGVGDELRFFSSGASSGASSSHSSRSPAPQPVAVVPTGAGLPELQAEVVARGDFGERRLRFTPSADFFAAVERIGHVPLPPYIDREDGAADRERYQTIYAQERGSIAAPTAGLHFTPEVLARIQSRGIETVKITLHVGLGTFQPVRAEHVEQHHLHREAYAISPEAAAIIHGAMDSRRRVVAVGTTTVRALEHAAGAAAEAPERGSAIGRVKAGRGEADTFIYPGYQFRVVGALLTNFHLPQSSLLMMVCALGGSTRIMGAYRHAVGQKYRFYSYGDCMFVE